MYCGPPNPDGVLTLATIVFDGPAIHALDPGQLWQRGQKRGTDRLIPFPSDSATGVVGYPRRYKPTKRTIHFGLHGNVSLETGDPVVDYIQGAYTNLDYLNSQVCDPSVADSDGTIPASLVIGTVTLEGAVTIEDEIVVNSMLDAQDERGAADYLMTCAVSFTIAQGALIPA